MSGMIRLPVPAEPTIAVAVSFAVGSQDDPPGKTGSRSSRARCSSMRAPRSEILEALYPLAANYGARVDRERTTLSGLTHRDTAATFLELFGDAYLLPAFPEEDFERIVEDAINEIENTLRYSSDEEPAKATLYAAIFRGTRYAHPPIEPPPLRGRKIVIVDKPGADASLSFGFPLAPVRCERDFYALLISNSWFGEHRHQASHLFQVIREIRGLNYGDYSYIEAFPDGDECSLPPVNVPRRRQVFKVWIRTLPNAQAIFALRTALRELDKLIANGMTAEDFELTRKFLKRYSCISRTRRRCAWATRSTTASISRSANFMRAGSTDTE